MALRGGMTERGTTRAGEPQITGVPRVHRTLELDGCGSMEDNIRLGSNKNFPVDVTSNDPRQSSDERGEVIPSRDEIKAWLGGRLVGPQRRRDRRTVSRRRWRQPKGPDEPQAALEEVKVKEYKPQGKERFTAVPRASPLQEVVPSREKPVWDELRRRDGGPRGK